jgi:hypothetical protein
MFNLTEMVEELLLASGKPRKTIFEDVDGDIPGVITSPPGTSERVPATKRPDLEVLSQRRARFGSLGRRRRVLAILSAPLVVLLLTWVFLSSGLAPVLPFSDGATTSEDRGQPAVGGKARGGDAEEAKRVEAPDVSGRDVGEAARTLSRAGFEVTTIKAVKSPKEAGTVLKTKPSKVSATEKQVVIVMSGGPTGIPSGT